MPAQSFDLAVVGGGPGGYVAAIRAAQLELKVVLVEREHLGGICLNWGCIPTKALLASADVLRTVKAAASFGIEAGAPRIQLTKLVARSREVADQLSMGIRHLLKKNSVTVIMGVARLSGPGAIAIDVSGEAKEIKASHIILATGALARHLPGVELSDDVIVTYKGALQPKSVPNELLVVGSGAIGTEFASFYAALGSKVTIAEALDRLVPLEDSDISAFLESSLRKEGLEVLTSAKVSDLKVVEKKAQCKIGHSGRSEQRGFDKVILAVGITPNTEDLGLDAAGVRTDRGLIVIDEFCQTSAVGVYAIGDIVEGPWLAHKASHEAIVCVEKIAGVGAHKLDRSRIPACIYSHPQIGSIGLTERAAREEGLEIEVGSFPYLANGKAIALGEQDGFVKTIYDKKTGELLGAHVIGAEATELISGFSIGKNS